ncbi:hypothetical protein SFRURICE_006390 [Spodoptera frugiperda]|nr:hypothetical protein SFRURICE_006390 [Spodoptera frugiperda]
MKEIKFGEVFGTSDAEQAFTLFHTEFKLFFDLCFPIVKIKINTKTRPKWLSNVSRLRYAIIFWGNDTNWERVFKCQKKCIRAMCGLKQTDSCKEYFKKLGLLTVPSIYILESALFIKQNSTLFTLESGSRNRSRLYNNISRTFKTALYEKSVFNMATKIYNKIPKNIKDASSINIFKHKLTTFLIERCYYSLCDFLT